MIEKNTQIRKYIVFPCKKCCQYTYGRVNQKGKKCPRCGKNHKISEISGEIVNNLKEANLLVRKKQDGFTIKNGFKNVDLASLTSGFSIPGSDKSRSKFQQFRKKNKENDKNSYNKFIFELKKLKCNFSTIPQTIFNLFFINKGFKSSEIRQFTKLALKDKKIDQNLKTNDVKYYQIIV